MAYSKGAVGWLRKSFYAWILKKLTRLVFGAQFQRNHWASEYGLRGVESTVIYNGVDTDWFSPTAIATSRSAIRESLGMGSADFVLLTVAGLRPVKNLLLLLDTVNAIRTEYPWVKAILVGDGPERTRLEARAEELGVKDLVLFTGNMKDVRPALSASDLFVLTSDSETFPNAALEAMSMEKPVILPNIGGCPEMVSEGVNGWLFSVGSTASLGERIRRAADVPDQCRTMGAAARQSVLERFPMSKMLSNYETLIREVALSLK